MPTFDFEETFGDDYLHFYLRRMTEERNLAETEAIIALLELRPGDRVLDVPCGHGRIANLLAARGMVVGGLDASALLLEHARQDAASRGVVVEYVRGDMRRLPWRRAFDAVVCWFTSFGYFDDADNLRVLAEFRRALRPEGRLLIETLHHDGFVRSLPLPPAAFVSRVGDDVLVDETTFDPVMGRTETDRTVVRDGRVRRSHHSVRLPTVPEFTFWLREAGFATVAASDRGGGPLTVQSGRLIVVAR